jgi:hypothetical protein
VVFHWFSRKLWLKPIQLDTPMPRRSVLKWILQSDFSVSWDKKEKTDAPCKYMNQHSHKQCKNIWTNMVRIWTKMHKQCINIRINI